MAREKHRPMAARGAMSVPHFQFIPKKNFCASVFPHCCSGFLLWA